MRLLVVAVLICAAAGIPALAQDEGRPITGTYFLSPPAESEDPNAPADYVSFYLDGDVAKSMWDAITVAAAPEECSGRMAKRLEKLVCYGPPAPGSPDIVLESPYDCYVGINLKSSETEFRQEC
ncbi:hypothetical protein [Dongia sp. agr-C8]